MRNRLLVVLAVPLALLMAVGVVRSVLAEPAADTPPKPPLGLPAVQWPDDNPYTAAKSELGRFLYFDKRISSDNTLSCASCHETEKAFTDSSPFSTGIGGKKGGRGAPTVINRAYSTQQFWDGRAGSLEEQAKGPIANPIEMTADKTADEAHEAVARRLRALPGYVQQFDKVFGPKSVTIDNVAKAIATFERTVYSGNAPYDKYNSGDTKAMSEAAVRGMNVFFNKAACDACHIGFNFTDGSYVNIGIGMDKSQPDLGRFDVSKKDEDKGAFKTPTLREIVQTAPYMHDGRFKTLEEVIEHYDKGGIKNPQLDERMKPLNLSKQDKSDLVEFLKALSGEGWQDKKSPKEFPK
ncbi:MAG: c-type cytochrome [Planctomycetaceae bacterium]|nr:c-type cytochrome [Planctomycetaceae bacterium]